MGQLVGIERPIDLDTVRARALGGAVAALDRLAPTMPRRVQRLFAALGGPTAELGVARRVAPRVAAHCAALVRDCEQAQTVLLASGRRVPRAAEVEGEMALARAILAVCAMIEEPGDPADPFTPLDLGLNAVPYHLNMAQARLAEATRLKIEDRIALAQAAVREARATAMARVLPAEEVGDGRRIGA